MIFDPNQTEFAGDYQRVIWQFGTHIVPPEISLADVEDPETREGCMQIYGCTIEILGNMYSSPDDYGESPRLYTGDYLAWLANGSEPMKKHGDKFARYLQLIPRFGFTYSDKSRAWSNDRYPFFLEYFPRFVALAKERKRNLGGYLERRDFRLFAKRIRLSPDDLLRPLSDRDRAHVLELHNRAVSMGMKTEMQNPCSFRYKYKKLYSLELHNNPLQVRVIYRLDNGKHIHDQFERFFSVAEKQPDADALVRYIQGGIEVCTGYNGLHKGDGRCGRWLDIRGARRLASMCHPAIGKYRRGTHAYLDEDIGILLRMIDVRIAQVDDFYAIKKSP